MTVRNMADEIDPNLRPQDAYFTLQELYDGGLRDSFQGMFALLRSQFDTETHTVKSYRQEGVVQQAGPLCTPIYRMHYTYSLGTKPV